jgi:hypothetical protein
MEEQQDLLSPKQWPPAQNLPNATATLVLGIISIIGSFCYGFPGLICGIIGLVLGNKDRKLYQTYPEMYNPSSLGTSNAGRVCSIIGICIGGAFLLLIIVLLIVMGSVGVFSHKYHSY